MLEASSDSNLFDSCRALLGNEKTGRFLYDMIKDRIRNNKQENRRAQFFNVLYSKLAKLSKDEILEIVAYLAVSFDFNKYNSADKKIAEKMITDYFHAYKDIKKRGVYLSSTNNDKGAYYIYDQTYSEQLAKLRNSWRPSFVTSLLQAPSTSVKNIREFYKKLSVNDDSFNQPSFIEIEVDGKRTGFDNNVPLLDDIVSGNLEKVMICLELHGLKHNLRIYNKEYGTHPLLAIVAKGYKDKDCERIFEEPYNEDMTYRVAQRMLSIDPGIVNLPHLKTGDTPLHVAAAYGDIFRLMNLLIEYGANVNAVNNDGHTADDILKYHTAGSAYEIINGVTNPNYVNLISNGDMKYKSYDAFDESKFHEYREQNMKQVVEPIARKQVSLHNSESQSQRLTSRGATAVSDTDIAVAGKVARSSFRSYLYPQEEPATQSSLPISSSSRKSFWDRVFNSKKRQRAGINE